MHSPRRTVTTTSTRKIVTVLSVVLAAVLGTATAADAASENHLAFGNAFADGDGVLTDDWGDHFSELGNSLCNGCAHSYNTDIVMMWQAILAADGFLTVGQIDGQFGPITATATRSWQKRYGIGIDGEVGPQTWSTADDRLTFTHPVGGDYTVVEYRAREGNGTVAFWRGAESLYNDAGAYQLVTAAGPNATQIATFADPGSGTRIRFNATTLIKHVY